MAERGIKWRSPGEVWRAYEAEQRTEALERELADTGSTVGRPVLDDAARARYAEEAARIDYAARSGGRDLV